MVINQGDIFWIDVEEPTGSEPGYRHPHVVVQNNVFNRSRINTVAVCALTSNLKRAAAPGNVLLEPGETDLPKQSVVNVSQIFTVDKTQLGEKIGTLSAQRVRQILDGLQLLMEPREVELQGRFP
jgi:mRNA interferase MazF